MRIMRVVALCGLVLTIVGPGLVGTAASQPDLGATMTVRDVTDEEAIRAVVAEFETGWNRHDAAAMFTSYADSADFVTWRGTVMRGRGEIVAHHARIHAANMKESVLRIEDTKIRLVRPDVAIVRVGWRLEGAKEPGTTKPVPARTGYLLSLMTRENGRWLVHTTQNTDILPPRGSSPKAPPGANPGQPPGGAR